MDLYRKTEEETELDVAKVAIVIGVAVVFIGILLPLAIHLWRVALG